MYLDRELKEKLRELYPIANEYLEISITTGKVSKNEISDIFNIKPFENNEELNEGVFVFVDLCTLANWSHACEYLLINKDTILREKMNWMPNSNLKLTTINIWED